MSKVAQPHPPLPLRVPLLALGAICYAWILHYIYANIISPEFFYLGATYRTPSLLGVAVSVIAVITLSCSLPSRVRNLTDFTLWTLFLISAAPSLLIAQYADILSRGSALSTTLWITCVLLALNIACRHVKVSSTLQIRVPSQLLLVLAVLCSAVVTGFLVLEGGASFSLVGLTDVQDVRSSYKSTVETLPLLGYGIQFQTAVLNPLFMSLGVYYKKATPIVAGITGQLLIYSVTGYKLTVLSPLFVIALAVALRSRRHLTSIKLMAALTATMVLSVALDSLAGGRLFVTVFVNRLMAGPGVLTSAYFMVFGGQPKYLWSYSFLSPLTSSPYDQTPGYYVAHVFQGVDSQANASLFADGYANWGWPGVIVEAIFLVILLAVLEAAARNIPIAITAPSILVAALGLTNNSPFTSVLTGGFGGLILVFALWPRLEESDACTEPSKAERRMIPEPPGATVSTEPPGVRHERLGRLREPLQSQWR